MLRHALLGLLEKEARHGYDLKRAFESLLGGTWPLNIGQIYTTLGRLERDGLVESEVVEQSLLPDRKVYSITGPGRGELARWLSESTPGPIRLKDEFFVKLLVQQLVDSRGSASVVRGQRRVYMQTLAQLTVLLDDPDLDPATALVVEGAILHVEADLEWLDLCQKRLGESEE